VSPLVTQLPWSHHLIILGQSKRPEEREFYVRLAIQERWSKRELERQFETALFERVVLSPPKVSPAVTQMYPAALSVFRDAYTVEFLGLPHAHAEADLHRGLLDKLKDFLIELGRDFCFVGSEYPLQVGGQDAIDALLREAMAEQSARLVWTHSFGQLIVAAAQTTTRGHPGRACGNSVHPKTRPVAFQDQILSPADVSRRHPHP
jgi:predicted nuclease of restriction endonuclease-like (RecB) superfamily